VSLSRLLTKVSSVASRASMSGRLNSGKLNAGGSGALDQPEKREVRPSEDAPPVISGQDNRLASGNTNCAAKGTSDSASPEKAGPPAGESKPTADADDVEVLFSKMSPVCLRVYSASSECR
jgi:hypothetical protein